MTFDKDYKNLYFLSGGNIKKFDTAGRSMKNVDFEATFNYKPYDERAYMFDHVYRQIKDKFYVANLHGVDWDGYRKTYERFLPYINNNYDFQEMLSEMLGELNASHTGARYYGSVASLPTAYLGLFYDESYDGDGLKVKEVVNNGPCSVKNTDIKPGSIIQKIDGIDITAGMDYFPLLEGKIGKPIRLSVSKAKGGKTFDVVVKGISRGTLIDLLYKRWVERNRKLVDSLSNGRLAYVHVRAMNSKSFRYVYSELLSERNRNREAVIVDERHNGGGWLHPAQRQGVSALCATGQVYGPRPIQQMDQAVVRAYLRGRLQQRTWFPDGVQDTRHRQAYRHTGGWNNDCRVVGEDDRPVDGVRHSASGLPNS